MLGHEAQRRRWDRVVEALPRGGGLERIVLAPQDQGWQIPSAHRPLELPEAESVDRSSPAEERRRGGVRPGREVGQDVVLGDLALEHPHPERRADRVLDRCERLPLVPDARAARTWPRRARGRTRCCRSRRAPRRPDGWPPAAVRRRRPSNARSGRRAPHRDGREAPRRRRSGPGCRARRLPACRRRRARGDPARSRGAGRRAPGSGRATGARRAGTRAARARRGRAPRRGTQARLPR